MGIAWPGRMLGVSSGALVRPSGRCLTDSRLCAGSSVPQCSRPCKCRSASTSLCGTAYLWGGRSDRTLPGPAAVRSPPAALSRRHATAPGGWLAIAPSRPRRSGVASFFVDTCVQKTESEPDDRESGVTRGSGMRAKARILTLVRRKPGTGMKTAHCPEVGSTE